MMQNGNISFNISGSTFRDHASVLDQHTEYHGGTDPQDTTVQELRRIQEQLERTQPLIADALANLQEAIEKQDKPTISKVVGQLSSGFAVSVLSSAAGEAGKIALRSLGILP